MSEQVESRKAGEWLTHSTLREVYSSWWVTLRIDDVERPDGTHTDHEVVVGPNAAGMVVAHPERGVLMIWRHRFMPDTWAWEIPGGAVDEAEPADLAARRECLEETGWEPMGEIRHLSRHHPSVGLVRQTFDIFLATDAHHVGPPEDANEAARVEWRSYDDVAADLFNGAISDGFTQLAVTLTLGVTGRGELLER